MKELEQKQNKKFVKEERKCRLSTLAKHHRFPDARLVWCDGSRNGKVVRCKP